MVRLFNITFQFFNIQYDNFLELITQRILKTVYWTDTRNVTHCTS
jgi:hypothetical protein